MFTRISCSRVLLHRICRRNGGVILRQSLHRPREALRTPFRISSRLASTTVKVPNMGDSITEGTLVEWTKNKVSIEIRADQAGVLKEHLASVDDTLQVGAPLFTIDTDAQGSRKQDLTTNQNVKEQPKPEATPKSPKKDTSPKPLSSSDILPQDRDSSGEKLASQSFSRREERAAMSRMRQRIAHRLKEAQNTAASLTTFNEIDMSRLMQVRDAYKEAFEKKHAVKLGFMSAFVKACVIALREQPAVNAFIDGKEIVYHDYCDISVAVASPNGLVVPVIRNAEELGFKDVEKVIQEFAKKAKDGTLTIDEMTGGTFTISNGGVFGSLYGTPILNPPQSAILGMHGIFQRPIAVNGKVEIKPMMYVALTYDHRLVDGREAVLFLRRVKECIEDPVRILLHV